MWLSPNPIYEMSPLHSADDRYPESVRVGSFDPSSIVTRNIGPGPPCPTSPAGMSKRVNVNGHASANGHAGANEQGVWSMVLANPITGFAGKHGDLGEAVQNQAMSR